MPLPPILSDKSYTEAPVFTAANLLREARRQKGLAPALVPRVCVLDPDGDIVRALVNQGRAQQDPHWACYHTHLFTFYYHEIAVGIIGCAVGASFAVLIAEELFASGCELLISVTSAGQIASLGSPPYFILIERAVRDEGTSYHYQPPATYSVILPDLLAILDAAFNDREIAVYRGATWTTDAPFRETASAIAKYQKMGVYAVEMEAAALYAFAAATEHAVVCFAHVTNQMAQIEGDFEKGAANGSQDALAIIRRVAQIWLDQQLTPFHAADPKRSVA
jgi:uridine phosphorylase